MISESQETLFVVLAIGVVLLLVGWWFCSGARSPDPWDETVEAAIQDAPPLCHKCLAPQDHDGWFCPNCGTSTGPYNNCLPNVWMFALGETLRKGTCEPVPRKPGLILFYLTISFAASSILAPFYWCAFLLNLGKAHPSRPPSESP